MAAAQSGMLPLDLADSAKDAAAQAGDLGTKSGLLPRQRVMAMIKRGLIVATESFEENQVQPASLDLRIGQRAYRIRASFLPGSERTVQDQLKSMRSEPIELNGAGAVLEKNCVYLVELQERLNLQPSIFGLANPKSSTGRLDIFTRVIADKSDRFDFVPGGYKGPLFAEISPRSFSVKVRKGSKLNQIRFRRRNPTQSEHDSFQLNDKQLQVRHNLSPLVDDNLVLRDGLVVSVALTITGATHEIIGFKALKHTDPIDVDKVAAYDWVDYWEPVFSSQSNSLILDPDSFYILASKEQLHVPPDLAAEMVPIDPRMGEFRVHYAGFFDPGFGHVSAGAKGARAVLEVRSREVAFLIEHGQMVGRLVYEEMTDPAELLYGQQGSNYQAQGLKLSKHFKAYAR